MNIPNSLTISRLCMMPIFVAVYFLPHPNARMWAIWVLVAAFITDVLDGYIARTYNQISNLGKILDPIADKVMQITVLVCIAFGNTQLAWVTIFVLIKDCLLGIGALVLYRHHIVSQANWFGKVACFISLFGSILLLFPIPNITSYDLFVQAVSILIVVANAVALIAYTVVYFKLMNKAKNA